MATETTKVNKVEEALADQASDENIRVCTIVSLLPRRIEESKPSLVPGVYEIPACKDNHTPVCVYIKDGYSRLYKGEGQTFPVTHTADEIARSIVDDYCSAQLEADIDAGPAIFYLPGKYTAKEILVKFKHKLDSARAKQIRWFRKLIRRADEDWAATKQPKLITDIQRHAASALGFKNKEWMHEMEEVEYVKCPFCMDMIDSQAALCKNCKNVVNKDKAKELGLKVE